MGTYHPIGPYGMGVQFREGVCIRHPYRLACVGLCFARLFIIGWRDPTDECCSSSRNLPVSVPTLSWHSAQMFFGPHAQDKIFFTWRCCEPQNLSLHGDGLCGGLGELTLLTVPSSEERPLILTWVVLLYRPSSSIPPSGSALNEVDYSIRCGAVQCLPSGQTTYNSWGDRRMVAD